MKLTFVLFHYFPYGGLQRDFLSVVKACLARGDEVTVLAWGWEGELPPGLNLVLIKAKGWRNPVRARDFSKKVQVYLNDHPSDWVIGFNKVSGLDLYFAADTCYAEKFKKTSKLKRLLNSRYVIYSNLERAVFEKGGAKKIFILTEAQRKAYVKAYPDCEARLCLLPPNIDPLQAASSRSKVYRQEFRDDFLIADDHWMLLSVASDFRTKGLDRSLRAIASLPQDLREKIHFFVLGDDKKQDYIPLIKKLHIEKQVIFLGPREDLARFYAAADIFLHPARLEAAGKVILEAIVSGLPAIVTDCCGYAPHVLASRSGFLLREPFDQEVYNRLLFDALDKTKLASLRDLALSYSESQDLFTMVETLLSEIEQLSDA